MENNIMKNDRLIRYLNSVGKECFVRYFTLFYDDTMPNNEIAEIIHDEKGYTMKACNSRTGHSRMIIREGGAEDALRIICQSNRLSIDIIEKAKSHLKSIT